MRHGDKDVCNFHASRMKQEAAWPIPVSPVGSMMPVDGIDCVCHLISEFTQTGGETRQ